MKSGVNFEGNISWLLFLFACGLEALKQTIVDKFYSLMIGDTVHQLIFYVFCINYSLTVHRVDDVDPQISYVGACGLTRRTVSAWPPSWIGLSRLQRICLY